MLLETGIIFWYIAVTLSSHVHPNTWSVKVEREIENGGLLIGEDLDSKVSQIAADVGARNLGQVGELKGYYLFKSECEDLNHTERLILEHEGITWHKKESLLWRVKRRPLPQLHAHSTSDALVFDDPLYHRQWHLYNSYPHRLDCNVTGVWLMNITGKGAVVAIVDDGVEWRHPDLIDNYCKEGSIDLNSDDDDPTPTYDEEEENKHGTRCAGEVAALRNSICGVGIAFDSKFSGIRVLDGPTTDATEATAFNKFMDVNDVYSCSWGPDDDGKAIDGPHSLGKFALEHGAVAGRRGFGSIYVVASGNGGENDDNCNYDGYANSIYTITIGAVDEFGNIPPYAEDCASMMACSVSSGGLRARDVVTTDWSFPPGNAKDQCTEQHTGTSAATPLAAGMIALMLEARRCLTWRDVQHIIVMTAVGVDHATAWTRNRAGFRHSDIHGFGLMDAWRLVNAAKVWETVPWLTSFSPDTSIGKKLTIPCCRDKSLIVSVNVTEKDCKNKMISTLEHVTFFVNLDHFSRGKLKISLSCPSGTKSVVRPRSNDDSDKGVEWKFSTLKCWGEKPHGVYVLTIFDSSSKLPSDSSPGTLKKWKLRIYGSCLTHKDIVARRALVKSSYSGAYLVNNFSRQCPPGQAIDFDITSAISDSTIKLVTMLSCFLVFWAIYYTIEIAFCESDEKNKSEDSTERNTDLQEGNSAGTPNNENLFYNSTFTGDGDQVEELVLENVVDNAA